MRRGLIAAVLGVVLGAAAPAAAEVSEIRIVRPVSFDALPLMLVEHGRLIEKQVAARGLGEVKVRWAAPGKTGAVDALLAGEADFAVLEMGSFIVAWDRKLGTPQQPRGVAALGRLPYVLVTRNAAIRTIRDFSDHDRIAVPAAKTSGPALMLEMAAALEWGPDRFDRFDGSVRARSDEEAAGDLLGGKSEIDAHFSPPPYSDAELDAKGVHRVMDSFDIAGPHSDAVLAALDRFRTANPKLCAAVFAAVAEADAAAKQSRGEAAEAYVAVAGDREISVEDVSDLLADPDIDYAPAPAGTQRLADFMARIKRIKHRPESWKDLFFPEAQATDGN